ncbi:MAG: CRISPR-associated endonuclease Cas3'' [Sulfolobales archaeon]|nr:CRISPR-associated endonuclease Cas3'' [Sulfolobales archaeon]MCX8186886.1 CRISPR-associated endonuclease Cas3'' [Sulfolobales archaeon]MDW7970152.1 CRISPR-associated endonuclease Cas3'' [Sulfolobales archaeon]
MSIYAWCNSPLSKHIIDTAHAVMKVSKLNNICRVVANKLYIFSKGSNISNDDLYELIVTIIALHDIGKACENYQKTVNTVNGACAARFTYHEVVGAALMAEAIMGVALNDSIKYVATVAVLNHHHPLRDLNLSTFNSVELRNEIVGSAGKLMKELSAEIATIMPALNIKSKVTSDLLNNILGICEKGFDISKSLNNLITGISGRSGGYQFLIRGLSKQSSFLTSIVSGLINISDNISAYCRRGNKANVFTEEVLKELGISCGKLYCNQAV